MSGIRESGRWAIHRPIGIKMARHRGWTEGAYPLNAFGPVDGVGCPGFSGITRRFARKAAVRIELPWVERTVLDCFFLEFAI